MFVYYALLLAVGFERLAELVVAKRNAAWSRGQGGVEFGRGHYPVMVVLHIGLLAGCLVEPVVAHRPFNPALGWTMIGLVLAAQGLRWWCITTLGRQWNTRVIVVPDLALVRSGPYKYWHHPNYVAVVVEGAALPLAGSAWVTAVTFTCLNAALLTVRLRCETRALATVSGSGSGPVSVPGSDSAAAVGSSASQSSQSSQTPSPSIPTASSASSAPTASA
jgi:methyltransferase